MVRTKATARGTYRCIDDSPIVHIFPPGSAFYRCAHQMCRRRPGELDSPAKRTRLANSQNWELANLDAQEKCVDAIYGYPCPSYGPIPFMRIEAMKELIRLLRRPSNETMEVLDNMDSLPIKPPTIGKKASGPFIMLPPELHVMIEDYLDDFDFLSLTLANSYFFKLGSSRLKRLARRKVAGIWAGQSIAAMGLDAPFEYTAPHQVKVHGKSTSFSYSSLLEDNKLMPTERSAKRRDRMRKLLADYKPSSYGKDNVILAPPFMDSSFHHVAQRTARAEIVKKRIAVVKDWIKSKNYPSQITDVLKILINGEPQKMRKPRGGSRRRAIKNYDPTIRKYVIRNLTRKQYIEYNKSGGLAATIRDSSNMKWCRQGVLTCSPEVGAITAMIFACRYSGEPAGAPAGDLYYKKLPVAFYQGMWAGDSFDIIEKNDKDLGGWEDASDVVYGAAIEDIRTFWQSTSGIASGSH